MSTSNNKFLNSKRERDNTESISLSKKSLNKQLKSNKQKIIANSQIIEADSIEFEEFEVDNEKDEGKGRENSLCQLTKDFLEYIKKNRMVNININDLVKELSVKKRRIYDITNVLQGIGYIEKNGKNEFLWTKTYKKKNQNSNNLNTSNSLNEYLSNYATLKNEIEKLKKEDKEIEVTLNKFKDEFNIISKKQDFSKYSYITFNDISNLSKDDNLDFMVIKATKGTIINVIDDDESKKAYSKIKSQMENGKIQKNEKLLSTLSNLHHIFFSSHDEKLKIYKVDNGEITETFNNQKFGARNKINEINKSFNEKELNKENIKLNLKENENQSNKFIFNENIYLNNYSLQNKSNQIREEEKEKIEIKDNYNNIGNSNDNNKEDSKKANNKQVFTFGNEQISNSNFNSTFLNNSANKSLNSETK